VGEPPKHGRRKKHSFGKLPQGIRIISQFDFYSSPFLTRVRRPSSKQRPGAKKAPPPGTRIWAAGHRENEAGTKQLRRRTLLRRTGKHLSPPDIKKKGRTSCAEAGHRQGLGQGHRNNSPRTIKNGLGSSETQSRLQPAAFRAWNGPKPQHPLPLTKNPTNTINLPAEVNRVGGFCTGRRYRDRVEEDHLARRTIDPGTL